MDKSVIIFSNILNGIVFDTFEYFYRLWELDHDIKLITKHDLFNPTQFNQKYILNQNVFKNIINENPLKFEYKKVLIFGTTHCPELYFQKLKTKEFHCIENSGNKIPQEFEKTIYYTETTEEDNDNPNGFYPNGFYPNGYNPNGYKLKFYFDIQRIFEHKNCIYLNCLDKNNFEYLKLKKKLKDNGFMIYERKKNFSPESNKNFDFEFFKNFNHHIYVKTKIKDLHPRIFFECLHQGISQEMFHLDYLNCLDKNSKSNLLIQRFLESTGFIEPKENILKKRNIKNDILIPNFISG